ncbi:MAG: hypothetical protein HN904_25490 [Victivallales bacterium]|nr:hypothetical protein [Victivallales bacterium]
MTIQPVLVPCQGSADLFVTPDPADPGMLLIHWGTALLQRVPRDGSDPLLRLTAGLLYNLRFPLRMLDECLPLCGKTIRSIGRSLRECSRAELVRWILGRSNEGALSADQKQYVRVRYTELRSKRRDYREAIRSELTRFWGCEVCGDVLRRCFREVDVEEAAGKAVDGGTACSSPLESDAGAEGNSGCASAPLPSTATRNVSSVCGVATPQAEPMLQADAADAGAGAAETTDRPEAAEPDAGAEGNSGCASAPLPSTATRDGSSVPAAAPSPMDAVRAATPGEGLAPLPELAPAPWPIPFPTIPERGQWCAHAGLSLLLPWLEEALGDVPPPLQQLAMQILAGAVNHESSRYTSFESLRRLGPAPHRSTRSQRKWCKKNASDEILNAVFNGNWRLVKGSRELIFYFDPHTEEYTGLLKLLYGWSGAKHGPVKAIHLDFIHTADGFPCHVLHFDNYDDMRPRFLVSRERFKTRFGIFDAVAWIVDRAIWSKEFLRQLAAMGDTFVTWEKGYSAEKSDWGLPSTGRGKFSRHRCRNSQGDRRRYSFRWKLQEWDVVPNGRRVIVRARKPSGSVVEVAIVTNNPELSAERIVWLMFNRWIQESDFLYLRRHFGIGEMTERGHDAYADIASELIDRQVESRDHKQATEERGKKRGELASALLQQRGQGPVGDLDELRREFEALRPRLAEHEEELQRLRAATPDREMRGPLDRLGRKIGDIAASIVGNREARERARQAGATEKRICELEREIERIQDRIEEIPRTESRIQALIDQQYVRLRMRSRPLVDAVRITCRNIFRRPMDIFRPLFDNRRTDHAVLRALTRAPGIISATPERIDVRLIPTMTIEPAEREPIRRLLKICEHRAAAMAALEGGPALRFHLMLDNGEINKFLRTM